MKKFFVIMLPIFIMFAVALLCIGIYMIFTNKLPKKQDNQVSVSEQVSEVDNSIILSQEELPRIDASVSTQALVTALVKNFTQNKNFSDTVMNYSNQEEGYKRLLNGEIDILFATAPSDDILELAEAMGIELEMQPVAKEGFVFYVNCNNPVDSLNVSDIQKIYSGQVTNWSQLGGANLDIVAFQRTENSANQREMINSVMKNLQMVDAPKDIFSDKTYGTITDLDGTYDNSENALGYSYYYEAKVMYDFDANSDNAIKFLKINDVAPNYETIHSGEYPIQTNYYMIKNKNNNSEVIDIFINALFSDRGKNAIKEAGYIDS